MDVLSNRHIDDVIILGSGLSISSLTPKEIEYINQCKTVIALNKFMAFYKLSGVLPTHVFFLDRHGNSLRFLKHILTVCRNDGLKNLTFIFHKKIEHLTYKKSTELVKVWFAHNLLNTKKLLKRKKSEPLFKCLIGLFPTFKLPVSSSVQHLSTYGWLDGGEWAKNTNTKLYHYRGSLTSVLNYVSVIKPDRDIYLAGNDFNSSIYFFQKELNLLSLNSNDWTTPIIKKHNKHFSAIKYEGKTIFDKLPFIIQKLQESGNSLYCINPESLLVTKGNIVFKCLPVNNP